VTDNNERKPYFEPREAKPDHPIKKRGAVAVAAVNQVAPPDIQNEFDSPSVRGDHFPLLCLAISFVTRVIKCVCMHMFSICLIFPLTFILVLLAYAFV